MLVESIEHLSIAELLNRFPAGQKPDASDLGLIRSEVRERYDIIGDRYPYRADSAGVERVAGDTALYDFLLLASLEYAPFRQENAYTGVNRIFDLVVREALKAHLGKRSDAVRFGTPVSDGRPQDFIEAVSWLAGLMGTPEGRMDRPADDNDAGVDVVAWRHFADHRAGFPVILAQDTLQLDFELKVGRIPLESWKKWLDIGPSPQTALAVPFNIRRGDDRWMKVTTDTALLLDRLRLCELLRERTWSDEPEWEQALQIVDVQRLGVLGCVDADETRTPRVAKPRKQKHSAHRDPRRR